MSENSTAEAQAADNHRPPAAESFARANTAKAEALMARLLAGLPPDDDPRWALFNAFEDETAAWSQGKSKYSNATNGSATFMEIVRGFFDRELRPNYTPEEFAKEVEKWKA